MLLDAVVVVDVVVLVLVVAPKVVVMDVDITLLKATPSSVPLRLLIWLKVSILLKRHTNSSLLKRNQFVRFIGLRIIMEFLIRSMMKSMMSRPMVIADYFWGHMLGVNRLQTIWVKANWILLSILKGFTMALAMLVTTKRIYMD